MLPRYRINGELSDALSPDDRGLQYGDGVFETIAVRGGIPLRIDRHLARLRLGCERLGIPVPELADEACAFAREVDDAVLKIVVTRGGGGRGYRPPVGVAPTRILSLHPLPDVSDAPVALRWCATRLAVQPALAGIKHLNRLEQVLARAEWPHDAEWQDGLMQDGDGRVVCATQANLFAVIDGAVYTPPVDRCGVAGIVRGGLLEAGHAAERELERADVERADEVFVTNSLIGVRAVRRVGDVEYTAPGAVAERLQRWWADEGGR